MRPSREIVEDRWNRDSFDNSIRRGSSLSFLVRYVWGPAKPVPDRRDAMLREFNYGSINYGCLISVLLATVVFTREWIPRLVGVVVVCMWQVTSIYEVRRLDARNDRAVMCPNHVHRYLQFLTSSSELIFEIVTIVKLWKAGMRLRVDGADLKYILHSYFSSNFKVKSWNPLQLRISSYDVYFFFKEYINAVVHVARLYAYLVELFDKENIISWWLVIAYLTISSGYPWRLALWSLIIKTRENDINNV